MKISESSFLSPTPGEYVSTRGNGLSKCFIYLIELVCWNVCDGTGKTEVRIGGGLVF